MINMEKNEFLKGQPDYIVAATPEWIYESYFKKGHVTQEDCSWLVRLGYGYIMTYAYDNDLVRI